MDYKIKYYKYKTKYLNTQKINIHNLYISFNEEDRVIFYEVLADILKYNNNNNIAIVHIKFNEGDVIDNINYIDKPLLAEVVTIKKNKLFIKQTEIVNINNIIDIFKKNCVHSRNIFVYSGHSDGLYLIHKKIHILSLKNFMEIIQKSICKKADLIIGDACLLGNIGSLKICKNYSKYMISSPAYYGYVSMMSMQNLYKFTNLVTYGKNIIDEYAIIQKSSFNVVLYELKNKNLQDIIDIVKKEKDNIKYKSCAINKKDYYYVNVECGLSQIKYKKLELFKQKLDSIIKYQKYRILGNQITARLLIILKKPNKYKREDSNEFYKMPMD